MTSALGNELARLEAQRLAFAPLIFQACRALRDLGVLEHVASARQRGVTAREVVARTEGLSGWAAALLLEAGYAAGLCRCDPTAAEPRFVITPMGTWWLRDELTRVNAEFNHHVCYRGAFDLRAALTEGRPAGLAALAPTGFGTVYEALHALSPEVRRASFDFDHFYSDGVFELCLPHVLTGGPARLVDIGGNTGRFARLCLSAAPALEVTLVDLAPQLEVARAQLAAFGARACFVPLDVRREAAFPAGADVYWLSQFLDCFPDAEIVSILRRVRAALSPRSRVFILETYWNEQRFDAARFCVIGTSLYFACIANGSSRMYHSAVMKQLIAEAGLALREEHHHLGLAHSLLVCAAA